MKSLLGKINNKLDAQGGFLKAVSVLVGGTVFAQGLAILALPILTRIYDPTDFSLYAIYTSLVMILSVSSCLRLEVAIPIVKEKHEAVNLVVLAFFSNTLISLFIFIFIFIFQSQILVLLEQPEFDKLIWLVPLGIFFLGIYNIFQFWATRQKDFKLIAKTRIVQALCGVISQVLLGILGFFSFGLIVGQIIKVSAGIRNLIKNFLNDSHEILKKISFLSLKETFKRNKNFPKYSTFEALANTAGMQLPIIFIARKVGDGEAGHLMLAMQVMAIPIAFIGNAVSQIYLANASEKMYAGQLFDFTIDCIKKLIKIGVLPIMLISLCSPFIFPIIFGEKWDRSGDLMVWMFPWFALQLLVSPVSMSLHILGFQKKALLLQLIGFFIRYGGVILVSIYFSDFIVRYYSISGFIFYLLYLLVVLRTIKKYEEKRNYIIY